MTQLLGICGALRAGSTNRKLLREAVRLYGECTYKEADIAFPLYDGDAEAKDGLPDAVINLAEQIGQSDGVLISTPEYNKGPSGVLKNALDWVSRVKARPWQEKPVAVMSAAAGRAGGERAQMILRSFLVPFQARVLQGPELHLASSGSEFDEKGQLTGEIYLRDLGQLMTNLRAAITEGRTY